MRAQPAFDLVVIGAGMAGLTSAAAAAAEGERVLIVERARTIGGSSAVSGGYVWTARDLRGFRLENPLGDPELARAIVSGYDAALEWMRSLGVEFEPEIPMYHFGRGSRADVLAYHRRCAAIVEANGGSLITGVEVRSLVTNVDGRVVGLRVREADNTVGIRTRHTVLATGGFQGNPALRGRYIHRNARQMLLRSNPWSRGDGLRLATSVGADTSPYMEGFYGHLISSPTTRFEPAEYTRLAQYQSDRGILVNRSGDRFTDESAGDQFNTQAVLRQPTARAVMIVDERIRRDHVVASHLKGAEVVDRFLEAKQMGARYAVEDSPAALARHLGDWGYDGHAFLRALRRYNARVLLSDDPPRRRWHQSIEEPPFHALEVQPAITFTHGGIRIDRTARVLRPDGSPIPGLLAVGADAGGVYHKAYAGGLAMAVILGRTAAATAGRERLEQSPVGA